MPFKYEVNGQAVEFDKEPTTEDIDYAAQQLGGTEQVASSDTGEQPIFTQPSMPDIKLEQGYSNLSFGQDLMMGLLPNDESRIKYLTEDMPGKEISMSEDKQILVNGLPFNPKGFDMGDVRRNAGYIFPFVAQIVGSALGLATAPVTGPWALPISAAAGVSAAVVGDGIRLAIPEILGFDLDGKDVWDSVTETVKDASISEVVGLGFIGGGKLTAMSLSKLGKTKAMNGLADIWKKSVERLPTSAIKLMGVSANAAEGATQVFKPSDVFRPEIFDTEAMSKLAKKTLLGNESIEGMDMWLKNKGMQKGMVPLMNSIKEVNNPMFDKLVSDATGISLETIDVIKKTGAKRLEGIIANRGELPNNMASIFLDNASNIKKTLGESIGEVTDAALKQIGDQPFAIKPIADEFKRIIASNNLLKTVPVKGIKGFGELPIQGINTLEDLGNFLVGTKNVRVKGTNIWKEISETPDVITTKQAKVLLDRINAYVDPIFESKAMPSAIKGTFKEATGLFRDKFYQATGIQNQVDDYAKFIGLLEDAQINDRTGLAMLESRFKSWGNQSKAFKDQITTVANKLPGGRKLVYDLGLLNAADEIGAVNVAKSISRFEGTLSRKEMINFNNLTAAEKELELASNSIKGKNRSFFEKAQKILIARDFEKSSPNIMRVSTLAAMTGISALVGGIPGAWGGAMGAIALSEPRNIAKLLVRLEKFETRSKAIKMAKQLGYIAPKVPQKILGAKQSDIAASTLKALISQKQRE